MFGLSESKIEKWGEKKRIKSIVKALNSKVIEHRIAAIKALGVVNTDNALNEIIGTLRDPDPKIRLVACEVLGNMGNPKAATFITYTSENDEDQGVREAAMQALKKIIRNKPKEEDKEG